MSISFYKSSAIGFQSFWAIMVQLLDQAANFVFGRHVIWLSGGSASKGLGASTALLMLTTTNQQDVYSKLCISVAAVAESVERLG